MDNVVGKLNPIKSFQNYISIKFNLINPFSNVVFESHIRNLHNLIVNQ